MIWGKRRTADDPALTPAVAAVEPKPPMRHLFDVHRLGTAARADNEAMIRLACAPVYLRGSDALCWCLGRYKMFVDCEDIGLSTHLLMDGYWEMPTTEVMAQRIKPGMTVLDCGANLGYYSVLSADLVGPSGKVICFEPNPDIARRLRNSLSVNGFDGRVVVHETAVCEIDGEIDIWVPEGEPKNGRRTPFRADYGRPVQHLRVPSRTLDSVLGDEPVDFVKIDVEGCEEACWSGMAGIVARNQPLTVVFEYRGDRFPRPSVYFSRIAAAGFTIELIDPDAGARKVDLAALLALDPYEDHMLVFTR